MSLFQSPSSSAGTSTTEQFQGEQRRTDGQTADDSVKAIKNPGKKYVQTIVTTNDGSRSELADTDAFAEFKRMAQDTMLRENVPLGYRKYIVRYFDLIRPSDAEDETSKDTQD